MAVLRKFRATVERQLHVQWPVRGERPQHGMPRSRLPVRLRF